MRRLRGGKRILQKTLCGRRTEARGRRLAVLTAAALLWALPGLVAADEVLLANGDRLSGEIQSLGDGKLVVKTPYTKELMEIDWASVKGFRFAVPAAIVLKDGTELKGTTEIDPAGGIRVLTDAAGAVHVADLGLITKINPGPAVTYTGLAQAAASMVSGNSDKVNANLAANFVARSKRQRLTLRGAWNYGEDRGVLSARDAYGSLKYDFFPLEKLYTYVNSLLEYNYFQDLNLRSAFGGGLGYQFFEDKIKALSFELGVSYFNEDFRTVPDDAYAAGRWSVNAQYQVLPGKIVLFHFHEGYFGFENLEDLYLKTEQGVRFNLLKTFYTTFQANLNYDNTPAPGTEETDTTLLFGLGYAFDL